MLKDTETFLSSLVYALTGLYIVYVEDLSLKKSNQTAFIGNCSYNGFYIRLNTYEISIMEEHLVQSRGFTKGFLELEVVLHEVAHYRQYEKFIRTHKWFTYIRYRLDMSRRNKYHELVADRYAHYCLKIILRKLAHKDLFKIILDHKILRD